MAFGNNLNVEIKGLKKQGGEYRYLPYAMVSFCDIAKNDKYVYPDFAKGSDTGVSCPVGIGNYSVYNATSDLKNVPSITQIAKTGEYGVELIFLLDGKPMSKT